MIRADQLWCRQVAPQTPARTETEVSRALLTSMRFMSSTTLEWRWITPIRYERKLLLRGQIRGGRAPITGSGPSTSGASPAASSTLVGPQRRVGELSFTNSRISPCS